MLCAILTVWVMYVIHIERKMQSEMANLRPGGKEQDGEIASNNS